MKKSVFALSVLFTTSTIFAAHASEQAVSQQPDVLEAVTSDSDVPEGLNNLEPSAGGNLAVPKPSKPIKPPTPYVHPPIVHVPQIAPPDERPRVKPPLLPQHGQGSGGGPRPPERPPEARPPLQYPAIGAPGTPGVYR